MNGTITRAWPDVDARSRSDELRALEHSTSSVQQHGWNQPAQQQQQQQRQSGWSVPQGFSNYQQQQQQPQQQQWQDAPPTQVVSMGPSGPRSYAYDQNRSFQRRENYYNPNGQRQLLAQGEHRPPMRITGGMMFPMDQPLPSLDKVEDGAFLDFFVKLFGTKHTRTVIELPTPLKRIIYMYMWNLRDGKAPGFELSVNAWAAAQKASAPADITSSAMDN